MLTIITPPNTAPPVQCVWMFVSRDEQGRENVCGSLMGPLGMQPLITGDLKTLALFIPLARQMREQLAPGRSIHLLKFTEREEVTEW